MSYRNLFFALPLVLLSCHKQDRDLSVNAVAVSSVSSILADRQTCWWHQGTADTMQLYTNISYGISVAFYHIDGTDTINVSEQVLAPENKALVFWTSTDPYASIDFKNGLSVNQGTQGSYQSTQAGGPHSLGVKLLYQADPNTQSGDLMFFAVLPVVVN